MKKLDINKVISETVLKNKSGVINALAQANINVTDSITDRELYELVMHELNQGNPDVILHVGNLLTDTFDMSSIQEEVSSANGQLAIPSGGYQGVSNTGATAGGESWWSQNKNNIFSSAVTVGSSLLGNLFGKNDTPPTTVAPQTGGGNNTAQMMMMMQQQQASQAAADRRRREEEDARRRSTMTIVGVVAGVLVLGTVITVIALKSGK